MHDNNNLNALHTYIWKYTYITCKKKKTSLSILATFHHIKKYKKKSDMKNKIDEKKHMTVIKRRNTQLSNYNLIYWCYLPYLVETYDFYCFRLRQLFPVFLHIFFWQQNTRFGRNSGMIPWDGMKVYHRIKIVV